MADGPEAGRTLADLCRLHAREILGKNAPAAFPLLVKFIDAADWLSLQIHPDAEAAARLGGQAKTECWVVVEAAADAFLYLGLAPGRTARDLAEALAAARPEEVLRRIPVTAGDCLFVPAGTVHAIGPGIVLAEVQQNSNTTYRLSDWNRPRAANGTPRPLHVEAGLSCVRTDPRAGRSDPAPARPLPGGAAETLVSCETFVLERIVLSGPFAPPADGVPLCLGVLAGRGRVSGEADATAFAPGDWFLATAAGARPLFVPEGAATLLATRPVTRR